MALILESDLNSYIDDTSVNPTKAIIVGAAEQVVIDYLGYDPTSATRSYSFLGTGYDFTVLPVPGASAVASVKIGDETLDAALYALDTATNQIVLDDGYYFTRNAKVVIAYTAGWATIPNAIKLATLRIAALMYDEAHGNIGITGKQFADLSKQFINYSNYDKYLRPLSRYRAGGL
jgi:hypothetical protein